MPKAIKVEREMCGLWKDEGCDHHDCPFAQVDIPPGSVAHPKCELPDWPEVTIGDMEKLVFGIPIKYPLATFPASVREYLENWLRSIHVEIKEEKDGH